MPESQKGLYNGTCNPPRRVKRPTSVTASPNATSPMPEAQSQPRPILPRRSGPMAKSSAPTTSTSSSAAEYNNDTVPLVPAPSKRGRKPGPLSRAAREAQRRLNHSIIEKARRTKINEALATLKELVPAGYGASKSSPVQEEDEEEDEDGDDGEYQDGEKKARAKAKGSKKEEKEKEFKLEILIRTVSFMQDLLARVENLEKGVPQHCPNCADPSKNKKRKRTFTEGTGDISDNQQLHTSNRRRMSSVQDLALTSPSLSGHPPSSTLPMAQAGFLDTTHTSSRLPSISSWLPDSAIDPSLVPSRLSPVNQQSHLPSPPASTPFDPVRMFAHPPRLSLGPVATAAMLSPSASSLVSPTTATMSSPNTTAMLSPPDRTPEDENAASLLLQISASRSRSLSSPYKDGAPGDDTGNGKPGYGSLPLGTYLEVQTPGSILGLNRARHGRQ